MAGLPQEHWASPLSAIRWIRKIVDHGCSLMMQRVLGRLRSARQFSSSATIALHGVHELPTEPAGYVELRQYTLHPDGMKAYLKLTEEHVESRKRRTPFLGCQTPPAIPV